MNAYHDNETRVITVYYILEWTHRGNFISAIAFIGRSKYHATCSSGFQFQIGLRSEFIS